MNTMQVVVFWLWLTDLYSVQRLWVISVEIKVNKLPINELFRWLKSTCCSLSELRKSTTHTINHSSIHSSSAGDIMYVTSCALANVKHQDSIFVSGFLWSSCQISPVCLHAPGALWLSEPGGHSSPSACGSFVVHGSSLTPGYLQHIHTQSFTMCSSNKGLCCVESN